MDKICINGGKELQGQVTVSGAKNACLALMPLTILASEPIKMTNVPRLSDINTMKQLLISLGSIIREDLFKGSLHLHTPKISSHDAAYDIVRKMRASILVLGPLLAREGRARVSLPGGCAIGARPVDLHLFGLEKLGATLDLKDGYIRARASSRLRGNTIEFPFISVGATENLIMAATLAKGTTVLKNSAKEPEIIDLCNCINSMGGKIEGMGSSEIVIEGVDNLKGTQHEVLGDRIEMGTFMLAPAMAGGQVIVKGCPPTYLTAFTRKLSETGISVETGENEITVTRKNDTLKPINVVTEPFPGFPTDLQAQMMALTCLAKGKSTLEEKIFENRFMHAPELIRMGARIEVQGGIASVTGVDSMKGAPVMATDLRASVSLILAGLASKGETVVSRVYHLDRGYENIERKLATCGAQIERVV